MPLRMHIISTAALTCIAVLTLGACVPATEMTGPTPVTTTVSGTVTYRQRTALPPGAVTTVQLQDVSLADAPATILGEQQIAMDGKSVPVPYVIAYDPAAIDPRNTYSVAARITDAGGKLLFISDTMIPVITRDSPTADVEIVVVPVAGGDTSTNQTASVTGTLTYLQRIALPPGSVANVQIQDVSRAGAPAEVIGEQEFSMDGKSVPVAFAVPYDPSKILDNHRYSVRATIRDAEGKLRFTTDTITPVITGGSPTSGIELILVQVGS